MSEMLSVVFPGFALSVGLLTLVLAGSQFYIFKKQGYARSLRLGLYCLISVGLCLQQFMVHSRSFSVESMLLISNIVFFNQPFNRHFYMRSLSYYVAVPKRLLKFYYSTNYLLMAASFYSIIHYFFLGGDIIFDINVPPREGSFFFHSFTDYLGGPTLFTIVLLSIFALIDIVVSLRLCWLVARSSKDMFLITGLLFTALAATTENFVLAFTALFYIPLYFVSNLFEASRMCFLSVREYLIDDESAQVAKNDESKLTKYQNSVLSEQRMDEIATELTYLLKEKQIYKDPNLRLDKLSRTIGIPSYQMSQVINNHMKTTFYDLLNLYRINAIKDVLASPTSKDQTIIQIAYEYGFNSKSTFNTSFKRIVGLTPSQFRKSQLRQDEG